MPGLLSEAVGQLLATLGAGAILFGSVLALRQQRLKLLIAYSTVAQIGYLFLIFPLAPGLPANEAASGLAWTGGWLQLFSHAFAKAAMFMAAGLIAESLGHDRIADLGGVGRDLPIATLAFALAGLSLMGVPPSGGFVAKWLLLLATVMEGQWWWAAVILVGGLRAPVSRGREMVALTVALCAILLGLLPLQPAHLLQVGRPAGVQAIAR
jgi:formate hydrogenlyase subunit 3/multisubunit Na+/H+ antiporter MnhD subunit